MPQPPSPEAHGLDAVVELAKFFMTGALSMLARILLNEERFTWPAFGRVCGAGLICAIAGKGLATMFDIPGALYASVGVVGIAADRIVEAILKAVQRRGKTL